jgi:predicted tellurium resistance membrane protein TerC
MLELLTDPQTWVAFLTLTALELVLGIDNVVFLSILVDKLPKRERELARIVGLSLALLMRIALLFLVSWLASLVAPLFSVGAFEFSGRDLILIGGGLFLVWKSTREIHESLEGPPAEQAVRRVGATFRAIIVQIVLIDAIFSLDSIITAVGLVDELAIIIAAVVVSIGALILFAAPVGRFVSEHPTVKMLALSFLLVIGVVLIADGFDYHVPKGYVYFSLAFSVLVEMLNLRVRGKGKRHSAREPEP